MGSPGSWGGGPGRTPEADSDRHGDWYQTIREVRG